MLPLKAKPSNRLRPRPASAVFCAQGHQSGAALLVFLALIVVAASYFLVSALNRVNMQIGRDKTAAAALAQAKEALIGYSVSKTSITETGYLPLPDIGWTATPEGNSEGTYGSTDISLIGKVPWKTLGIAPVRDGNGECLWFVLSGRFKNSIPTLTLIFNWDTQGQIDVIDINGNGIANNVAALIVAPGSVLDSQSRLLANPALTQCGGNYDARNYLDSYNSADAIAGETNYFAGSTNNMRAPDTNNKTFVLAKNDHYNDRFLFVTVDEIFRTIIRRSDFSAQITALLDDTVFIPYLQNPLFIITGAKGTSNVDCNNTDPLKPDNKTFCENWKEMLLLTQLPAPSPITIDGVTTAACTRVLIFGGQKTAAQVRLTAADKAAPANYLEDANLAAFATPTATASSFSGDSTFNANSPSADLLRCL